MGTTQFMCGPFYFSGLTGLSSRFVGDRGCDLGARGLRYITFGKDLLAVGRPIEVNLCLSLSTLQTVILVAFSDQWY